MSDYRSLYQEVILDHNKKPRNYGTIEHPQHHAVGHNPLCGDHISVDISLNDDRIENIAFQGESCAICKASASMMTVSVKGKTRTETETLIQEFLAMATGKLSHEACPNIGRLAVFAGISDLPTRVKCAILPWHTLHSAFTSEGTTSTEAEADPMHAPIVDA
jgi:nitrogen fixation NifU-like protein